MTSKKGCGVDVFLGWVAQIVPGSYLFMSEDEVTPQNDKTKLD